MDHCKSKGKETTDSQGYGHVVGRCRLAESKVTQIKVVLSQVVSVLHFLESLLLVLVTIRFLEVTPLIG